MNEQLQAALVAILDKTMSGIDASVEFMQAELPDVIQQLLTWYMVKGFVTIFIGMALMIPIYVFIKIAKKQDIANAKTDSFWVSHYTSMPNTLGFGAMLVAAAFSIMAFVGFLIAITNIYEPLQIWIAPKIWLIEYAAQLAK